MNLKAYSIQMFTINAILGMLVRCEQFLKPHFSVTIVIVES